MDSDESEVRRRRQNPMRKMKTTGPAAMIVTSQHRGFACHATRNRNTSQWASPAFQQEITSTSLRFLSQSLTASSHICARVILSQNWLSDHTLYKEVTYFRKRGPS
jgi:hypothetical protein